MQFTERRSWGDKCNGTPTRGGSIESRPCSGVCLSSPVSVALAAVAFLALTNAQPTRGDALHRQVRTVRTAVANPMPADLAISIAKPGIHRSQGYAYVVQREKDVRRHRPSANVAAKVKVNTVLAPRPNKSLRPDQVVKIQMEALQHNDVPKPDSGIATTFAFASPQNRVATGPLAHFTLIVKSPSYLPMLNCKAITYEPIVVDGDNATQRVRIIASNGGHIAYVFMLSLQKSGQYAGCWMNDGCVRDQADEEQRRFDT